MIGTAILSGWGPLSAWIVEALVASTLLLGFVLAIREPVARHFGPRIAYLLWLLPALRMIMPPLPPSWSAPNAAAVETIAFILSDVTQAPVPAAATSWSAVLAVLWSVGAVAFFGWHMLSYLRFSRAVRSTAMPLFSKDRVSVQSSSHVRSPMAFGLFGKMIILPSDFSERYDPAEQRFAIDHELTHHRRGDLAVNLLAMGLLSLHWCNPLAHIAWRAFRLDQEAACDAIVLDGASAEERHAYGNALFKSAAGNVPLAACTINAPATLKKRLRIILDAKSLPARAKSGALLASTVVLVGLALTASGGIAASATKQIEANGPVLVLSGGIIETARPAAPWAPPLPTHKPPKIRAITRSAALPTPPQPPIPSAPPVARQSEAPAPVAPAPLTPSVSVDPVHRITSVHRMIFGRGEQPNAIGCDKGITPHIITRDQAEENGAPRRVTVIICATQTTTNRVEMRKALEAARANLSQNPMAGFAGRDRILASLDKEISRLVDIGTSLQ